VPRRAVSSDPYYTYYTPLTIAKFHSNSIFQSADDITVVSRITNNDEAQDRKERENVVNWCDDNNFTLNVNKTKEIVIDFRKRCGGHAPIYISGEIEIVDSFKFLGVQITNNLS